MDSLFLSLVIMALHSRIKDANKLCEKYNIYHRYSNIYHPWGNGQVKHSNKTIVKILQKTINESSQDWHLQLNPDL